MSSNLIQSGNQSYLKNSLGSIDDVELDDAALRAVNGGITAVASNTNDEISFQFRYGSNIQFSESVTG